MRQSPKNSVTATQQNSDSIAMFAEIDFKVVESLDLSMLNKHGVPVISFKVPSYPGYVTTIGPSISCKHWATSQDLIFDIKTLMRKDLEPSTVDQLLDSLSTKIRQLIENQEITVESHYAIKDACVADKFHEAHQLNFGKLMAGTLNDAEKEAMRVATVVGDELHVPKVVALSMHADFIKNVGKTFKAFWQENFIDSDVSRFKIAELDPQIAMRILSIKQSA